MFSYLVILLFFARYLSTLYCAKIASPRIFGGLTTNYTSFPYMTSIYNKYGFNCGGTLISTKCVLTAAHCLDRSVWNGVYVKTGTNKLHEGITRKGKYRIKPYLYDENTLNMDVGILRLESAFAEEDIETVDIDYDILKQGESIDIVGWGRINGDRRPVPYLQAANVTVMSQSACKQAYNRLILYFTDHMFCAKDKGGKDACEGDSGGPALRNGKQVGIVSWGAGNCGLSRYPGVYTKLSSKNVQRFLTHAIEKYC